MESANNEMRAWVGAERQEKADKETESKLKGVKWTTVSIKVPVCSKCGSPMRHELDIAARALWKWVCTNCRHTI